MGGGCEIHVCSQLAGSKTSLNTLELPKTQSVRRAHGDLALIDLQNIPQLLYRGNMPGQGHP